jgi:predicted alpha/beta-fold hydrolase
MIGHRSGALGYRYRAPWWLPDGHTQTIWPVLLARLSLAAKPPWRRERWDTPDGDFIDVDFIDAPQPGARQLVLFHGLEGSSSSQYATAFARWVRALGWAMALPHFRGCSGELNRAPRAYHTGDFEEVGWILQRLRLRAQQPLLAAGVSMGGNALLRWAAEAGDSAAATTLAVAALCSPIDLAASGHAMGRGLNRLVYTRHFLRTMKPKARAKWAQYPGLFDRARLDAARDLYEFDNVFTAPLHGFADTDDYWARASVTRHLPRLRIPALVVNTGNDPFIPASSLPQTNQVGRLVTLWQPAQGGHVGFPGSRPLERPTLLPEAVTGWMVEPG